MNYRFYALLAILSLVAFGCTQGIEINQNEMMKNENLMPEADKMMEDSVMEQDNMMAESGYKGRVLAGTTSQYLEFNKEDYDKALKENKKILLYFYANWCPLCKKENPEVIAAFNELNDPSIVGFRVNYKDSDTNADEEALAIKFNIPYQHTKVILKDSRQILKAPDSWGKERYLSELSRV